MRIANKLRIYQQLGSKPPKPERQRRQSKGNFEVDSHEAFRELRLKEKIYQESIGRVRQHVNPLAIEYQAKSGNLDWEENFKDPELPLIVDCGTGYGRFPLLAAKDGPQNVNYLGTEIRRPIVGRANFWAKELGLDHRVCFTFANITISLQSLLSDYPGVIFGIYIQFPDPSFKKRKIKRHIIQSKFVEECGSVLSSGGLVFIQSDVESCGVYSRNMFDHYGWENFEPHSLHKSDQKAEDEIHEELFLGKKLHWGQLSWLEENPLDFPTEREVYTLAQGLPVYRTLLVRTDSNA